MMACVKIANKCSSYFVDKLLCNFDFELVLSCPVTTIILFFNSVR